MALVRQTNRYLEENAPWKMAKTDPAKAGTVLYHSLEVVRLAAGMFIPIMPERTAELLRRIGLKDDIDFDSYFRWGLLQPGTAIEHGQPLFPRLELKSTPQSEKGDAGEQPAEDKEGIISFGEFQRTELVTARILSAEPLQGTDRLLILQVDIGEDSPRQLVAGIAEHYSPEELKGKMILVVRNLEPAVIRGVQSRGMLLAAKSGRKLTLVTVDEDTPPGANVS